MQRFLGIDHGTKRIGLAIGDRTTGLASPVAPVHSYGKLADDVQACLKAAQTYEADAFVVGLPLNMDGSEGPQALLVRKFGEKLEAASNLPVQFVDERLSTYAAEELIQPAGLTRRQRKSRTDSVAAQVFLQEFLDNLKQA